MSNSKNYTRNAFLNKVIERMLLSGWFIKSQNSHIKLEHVETKKLIVVSSSPSCPNAGKQVLRDIRRMGLELCS